ncbi:hypothetical protein EYF80_022771 [Liparis tanakae]|uniref:Uncharacterized protein n=1 Tax=Liparis tanakae TaxID=230148 RepID=A0A4Z2HMC1_9TELE|nr:hypothetical protein EYF80_022771 [Liparis tanakae]
MNPRRFAAAASTDPQCSAAAAVQQTLPTPKNRREKVRREAAGVVWKLLPS